jgi:hypothetical protein
VLYCNRKKRKLVNYESHMNEQRIHDQIERMNVSQKKWEKEDTRHCYCEKREQYFITIRLRLIKVRGWDYVFTKKIACTKLSLIRRCPASNFPTMNQFQFQWDYNLEKLFFLNFLHWRNLIIIFFFLLIGFWFLWDSFAKT